MFTNIFSNPSKIRSEAPSYIFTCAKHCMLLWLVFVTSMSSYHRYYCLCCCSSNMVAEIGVVFVMLLAALEFVDYIDQYYGITTFFNVVLVIDDCDRYNTWSNHNREVVG